VLPCRAALPCDDTLLGWATAANCFECRARRTILTARNPDRPKHAAQEIGAQRNTPDWAVVGPADVAALAVHIMANTALTGATYDIDGGQQFVGDSHVLKGRRSRAAKTAFRMWLGTASPIAMPATTNAAIAPSDAAAVRRGGDALLVS
jgi:hypothetical protein